MRSAAPVALPPPLLLLLLLLLLLCSAAAFAPSPPSPLPSARRRFHRAASSGAGEAEAGAEEAQAPRPARGGTGDRCREGGRGRGRGGRGRGGRGGRGRGSGSGRRPPSDGGAAARFNTYLHGLAREAASSPAAAATAEAALFARVRSNADLTSSPSGPGGTGGYDARSFNGVLNAHRLAGNAGAAAALLTRMEYLEDLGVLPFGPDEVSYSTVADAWAGEGGPAAQEEARRLLGLARERTRERERGSGRAGGEDLVAFNMQLDLLARGGTAAEAEEAERLLFASMRGAAEAVGAELGGGASDAAARPSSSSSPQHPPPVGCDVISVNTVLKAWGKCGSAPRAGALLERLEGLADVGALPFGPNGISYATVIDAWSRYVKMSRAPHEAERLLDRVEGAYRRGEGSSEDANGGGPPAPPATAAAATAATAATTTAVRRARVAPTIHMYAACIHAWARSDRPGSARRAERVLHRLEELCEVDDPANGGRGLLHHLRPNTVLATSVINAWGRSEERQATSRAEAVLRRMLDSPADGSMRPNVQTYAALINAYSNSGLGVMAAARAEELLDVLEGSERGDAGREQRLTPNVYVYTGVIKAWARSRHPEAGIKAEAILDRLEARTDGIGPNRITYTTAIDAWLRQDPEHEGPLSASRLLGRMERLAREHASAPPGGGRGGRRFAADLEPDDVIFSMVIRGLERSRIPDRKERADALRWRWRERQQEAAT